MTPPALLGPQLHRLEPLDVLPVEEHEPAGDDPLVDLEGVAGQDGPLHHHPVGVGGEQGAGGEQGVAAVWQLLEQGMVIMVAGGWSWVQLQ